jgi:hypothetical protein
MRNEVVDMNKEVIERLCKCGLGEKKAVNESTEVEAMSCREGLRILGRGCRIWCLGSIVLSWSLVVFTAQPNILIFFTIPIFIR